MLRDLSVVEFTKALESGTPTPGGGAAAGLSAALAAALGSMVFNLTIDKKSSKDYPEEVVASMREARDKTEKFRVRYLTLMDEDAAAFDMLMDGFRMPKETEEEKAARKAVLDRAKKLVLEIPWTLLNESFALYEPIKVATEFGNKNAISDAGVAAIQLHAAIEGAALNVFINLAGVPVSEENIAMKNRTDEIVELSRGHKEDIVTSVVDKIYGR